MSGIRLDHVALAVPRMADAAPFLAGVLGGRPAYGGSSRVYRFGQWRFANRARLEVLEPLGADGFLHRFLGQRGPGVHHVTFKVPSLREACARAEAHGYTIVGHDDSDPHWKEAFLHPRQALGIVVQLAESAPGSDGPSAWTPPPAPSAPPPAVAVIGLRMRARSRERARTQWEAVLQGEAVLGGEDSQAADSTVIYRWPRSPLRIVVEIDAARDEGPVAVEVASDRDVDLPPGPHPVLGAVFRRVPAGSDVHAERR